MMKEEILRITDGMQDDLLDFCKRIIEVKSNSGQEQEVAETILSELQKLKYEEAYIDTWGNVIGIIRGNVPGPTIMYNGHMDTVDGGNPESWGEYEPYEAAIDTALMENPFTGEPERTEVIHGRGSGDLKCGLASMIYAGGAIKALKERGAEVRGTFLLTAVVLEENGEMMGTIKLCEDTLSPSGIEPDAMICCEPSSLRVMLGHRGRMEIRVEVKGRSCHGSSPWLGVNAVEKSAELIRRVREMMDSKKAEDEYLGKPGIALTMYRCEPNELCVVPDKAVLVYDRRLIPGETTAGAIKEIQDIVDQIKLEDESFDAEVTINRNLRTAYTGREEIIESSKEVWIIDRDDPFVKSCASGLVEMGETVIYDYWAFSTDIPQLGTVMGKPAIGYGPGQEYLIHTPYEKVRTDFLRRSLPAYVNMYFKSSECDSLPMG